MKRAIWINGRRVEVGDESPATPLAEFLRGRGLTGTKIGCAEGDCGACAVALAERDLDGEPTWRSIASCIAPLGSFVGREIRTVEGLVAPDGTPHPVQEAMVRHHASQCGYCTPGFAVSLFEALARRDCATAADLADQLSGNLCRCTGYRPIRDAALELVERRPSGGPAPSLASPGAGALDWRGGGGGGHGAEGGVRFLRPASLDELFARWEEEPGARLLAGATEIGVEINKRGQVPACLLSVEGIADLHRLEAVARPDGGLALRLGAGATLTAIEAFLRRQATAGPRPALDTLLRMLRVFASRPIRSRATLGGNLATASPIGDAAPVLLALDARLALASRDGRRELPLAEFFLDYRRTALAARELVLEILLELPSPQDGLERRCDFFKVSKRRELDISTVAAAFALVLDRDQRVVEARLAYGGVAPTPRRAIAAEAVLRGAPLAEAESLAARELERAFAPIDDLRGSAAYRRSLVVSLWRKFLGAERSLAQDGDLDFAPSPPLAGGTSPAPGATDPGRALPHESGLGHATGSALFVDDQARRRSMLDAWPVLSPHAHARILRRDGGRALAEPGVVAVLFADDVPGVNNVGVARHDEPLLATDMVHAEGQIVALVVGESLAACRRGARLVDVDYEPLPPLLALEEAIAAGSFHTEPRRLERGDPEAALAAAPFRLAGRFAFGGQEHFYLETQAAWAEPTEDGGVVVGSSTQHPSEIQAMVAEVLGLARHRVVVQAPRMGGGFGGKETQGNAWASLVALAARSTGRGVRLQLDRDQDMVATGKRHPFSARFEVGFDGEGRLLGAVIDLVADGGWSLDLSQPILDRALFHVDNAYYLPAVRATGRVARTHRASNTAFRGFGGPQGMLVIEEILDRVARRLSLAPEIVRERNLYDGEAAAEPGGAPARNTTHYGAAIGDERLREAWRIALATSDFDARRRAVERFNREHRGVKRGLAITPVKFGISFTLTHYNQAGALVLLYQDGTAQVNHGGTEMGQGLHTKILGVAMRELGLPAGRLRIMPTATDKVPNTSATAASSGSDLNGAAVADACRTLTARLAPVAARLLAQRGGRPVDPERVRFADGLARADDDEAAGGVPFAAVCKAAYADRVSLAATGYYRTPAIHWNWATGTGRPFYYYVTGAAVAEVELDGWTGMHRVLRADIVEDAGDSLHPAIDRGQIEGGFVQGMGWLTREELLWDGAGRLLTHSASTYAIPAFSDAPLELRVTLLPDARQDGVVHGSKAVGEPPLMLAISVREALRDAVAAFGEPGGEVHLASPATAEALFRAISARRGGAVGPALGAATGSGGAAAPRRG